MKTLLTTMCAVSLSATPALAGLSPESFVSSLRHVIAAEAMDAQAASGAIKSIAEDKASLVLSTTDGALMTVRLNDDTVLVHFDSDVLFSIDSSMISSASRGALEDVAGVLIEYPKTAVVIQGHTDSTGSEAHNQDLSERRAGSVRTFLAGRGVNQERMATIGHGEGAPRASNATVAGRQQNRRVDILLQAKAT